MRFDDTNPAKEKVDFEKVTFLVFDLHVFSTNYFNYYHYYF